LIGGNPLPSPNPGDNSGSGSDYPSGVPGGLGPDYFSGGQPSGDPTSAASDPNSSLVQAAPGPLGDILGYQAPSQVFTLPDTAKAAGKATSDTATGDMTIPQAIDRQATAQAKATADAATQQDKTAAALAKATLQQA
jgi:hypothetical protein